jgi:hypothetical protein
MNIPETQGALDTKRKQIKQRNNTKDDMNASLYLFMSLNRRELY